MSNEDWSITILSTAAIGEQQFLRADGTWSNFGGTWYTPPIIKEVAKEPDPPGTAATIALGAAAVAAKNPVVSRRFWRRK